MTHRKLYAAYIVLLVAVTVVSVAIHLTAPGNVPFYAVGIGLGFIVGGVTGILAIVDRSSQE